MASVIVSIAMRNHHAYAISVFLMWVAGVAYTVLVVLHVWRILAFRVAVAVDLANPDLGFGFFTFIAGTDVLASPAATYSAPGSPPTDTTVPRSSCSRSAGSRGSCPDTWCRGAPCSATRASRSGNTRTASDSSGSWPASR